MICTLSIFALAITRLANASLSPTFPVSGSVCKVGVDCQIKWLDTPASPTAASMGETSIDLVAGDPSNLQLAQDLGGVSNPGVAMALTFKPDVTLASNIKYAIRFIPKNNPSGVVFSTFFDITGGNGTGKTTPLPSAGASAGNMSSANHSTSTSMSSTGNMSTSTGSMANMNMTSSKMNTTDSSKPTSDASRLSPQAVLLVLAAPALAMLL